MILHIRTALVAVVLSLSIQNSAFANTAPTKPGNLTGVALSSSSVELSWQPSTDDKRVRFYRVLIDGRSVAETGSLSYTVTGLSAGTSYLFEVDASDGKANSFVAGVTVSTWVNDSESEPLSDLNLARNRKPPADTSPGNCKGKNKKLPACQEPPVVSGPPAGWTKVFADNFDGIGDIDTDSVDKLWRFETMLDPLHRAGNSGMDELGNTDVPQWGSPSGKRWSAWYNNYNQDNAYRSNGNLVMQGLFSDEADPTRPNDYTDNGVLTQYGSGKLYTVWLDTWSRKYVQSLGKHVVDPDSPATSFKYGYFESRVNFSGMITPGFRLAMWLMPASTDAEGQDLVVSNAYDADGNNGVEIDLFEYEWISTAYENRLQLGVHGGAAGSSSTNIDVGAVGISLHQDWHTVGFLWQPDKMVWTVDGKVVKTVTDTAIIPDVYSYLIVSREMNSGVKAEGIDNVEPGDALEVLPYRPRDPGLYGQNIWEYRDRIAADRALIDYIRIWQP